MTTAIAIVMALVGATILVSYGRHNQLSSTTSDFVQQLGPKGGGVLPGSRVAPDAKALMGKTPMKNSDGVGNVIFDYETDSAEDYAAAGETVVACLQVRDQD